MFQYDTFICMLCMISIWYKYIPGISKIVQSAERSDKTHWQSCSMMSKWTKLFACKIKSLIDNNIVKNLHQQYHLQESVTCHPIGWIKVHSDVLELQVSLRFVWLYFRCLMHVVFSFMFIHVQMYTQDPVKPRTTCTKPRRSSSATGGSPSDSTPLYRSPPITARTKVRGNIYVQV